MGVNKATFPTKSGIRSYGNRILHRRQFALWIDLRSHADNEIHGTGLALKDTRDGGKLEIRRKVGGSGNITCDMFIVADALMEIKNSNLNSILY